MSYIISVYGIFYIVEKLPIIGKIQSQLMPQGCHLLLRRAIAQYKFCGIPGREIHDRKYQKNDTY